MNKDEIINELIEVLKTLSEGFEKGEINQSHYDLVNTTLQKHNSHVKVFFNEGCQFEKFWPESSQVARTKYYPESNTLEVEFKSFKKEVANKVYHYSNVSQEIWEKLYNCDSIGSFINKEVKGKFEYTLLESEQPAQNEVTNPSLDTTGL